jgi:hypothetical protein
MEYNRKDFLIESEDDEYITSCVIDLMKRTFTLYSNEGNTNSAICNTTEEFMNVLEAIRLVLPEKIIKYVEPVSLYE